MNLSYSLTLEQINTLLLEGLVADALSSGYVFSTLAQASPNEQEVIYWLHQECRKRQPPVETRQTPQDFKRWQEIFASPAAHPELYVVLHNQKEKIAVSCLVATEESHIFVCGFTGILPAHSGQGLALALKSHLILIAKTLGICQVTTSVRGDNPRMQKLNAKIGFRLEQGGDNTI